MSSTTAPRVEACIQAVIDQHPRTTPAALARYYEAVHQELAPLARQLEHELRTQQGRAGEVYDRLQADAEASKKRAIAAERRLAWMLENAHLVIDVVRRWDPAQGTLMEYVEHRVRKALGELT
jgi:hypothetical protein